MQKLWLVQVGFTAERVVGKAQAPNLETVKKKHGSRSPVKFNRANTVFHWSNSSTFLLLCKIGPQFWSNDLQDRAKSSTVWKLFCAKLFCANKFQREGWSWQNNWSWFLRVGVNGFRHPRVQDRAAEKLFLKRSSGGSKQSKGLIWSLIQWMEG